MVIGLPEFSQIVIVAHLLRCMKLGGLQALADLVATRKLHFCALHIRNFLLMCTLLWCKHNIMVIELPKFPQVSILGPIQCCIKWGGLQARTDWYGFCTVQEIIFLCCQYP